MTTGSMHYIMPRITPSHITSLSPGEIFVFGSNIRGHHHAGAARAAMDHFGAEWGVGEGMTGQTYALPTMEGVESFSAAASRFISYAKQHPDKTFLVTPVGCGIAGYKTAEVALMFYEAMPLDNVYLPQSFWDTLNEAKEYIDVCRYYKGGYVNPYENTPLQQLWFYEKCWVDKSLKKEKLLSENISEYIQYGLQDFEPEDGVPISLKALFFNRYCHWGRCDVEGFKAWYSTEYFPK